MPATAGRVRMPANNRVHSSAALQTHGIWQSAIGYDPYAPTADNSKQSSQPKSSNSEPEPENAYVNFQGLLALARVTSVANADDTRGACKKCGRVGHLTYQCRNFLSLKDEKDKDNAAIQADVLAGLEKLRPKGGKIGEESDEESEEEDSDSDSDVDSDIERVIAARVGKKIKASKKKRVSDDDDDSGSGGGKKRGRSKKRRSKKRSSSDSDDGSRKRKREKRRRRDDSSDEDDDERRHRHRKSRKDKRRRRSHRHSDDSEESDKSSKRKTKRAAYSSDSDGSNSDDSRVGRGKKRSEKRSRKHHCEEA